MTKFSLICDSGPDFGSVHPLRKAAFYSHHAWRLSTVTLQWRMWFLSKLHFWTYLRLNHWILVFINYNFGHFLASKVKCFLSCLTEMQSMHGKDMQWKPLFIPRHYFSVARFCIFSCCHKPHSQFLSFINCFTSTNSRCTTIEIDLFPLASNKQDCWINF